MRPSNLRLEVGGVVVSLAMGEGAYSTPRRDLGPDLESYRAVEVALLTPTGGRFLRPEDVGLPRDLAGLWEDGDWPVAPYVSKVDVGRIVLALLSSSAYAPGGDLLADPLDGVEEPDGAGVTSRRRGGGDA